MGADRVRFNDLMGYGDFVSEVQKHPKVMFLEIKARALAMLAYKKQEERGLPHCASSGSHYGLPAQLDYALQGALC